VVRQGLGCVRACRLATSGRSVGFLEEQALTSQARADKTHLKPTMGKLLGPARSGTIASSGRPWWASNGIGEKTPVPVTATASYRTARAYVKGQAGQVKPAGR